MHTRNTRFDFLGNGKKISAIEQPKHLLYKEETLDFELIINKNYCMNMKSVHVCFTIRFRKLTSAAANLAAHLMPVNNFFAHWDKEIDMTKVQIKASYQQQRPKKSIDILNPCLSSTKRRAK